MTEQPANRVAVITGGAIGIGAAAAIALAETGHRIVVTYHNHPADEVVAAITDAGGQARAVQLDVTSSQAVDDVFAEIAATEGHIDVLVNNAGGLVRRRSISEQSDADWHEVLAVNLDSAFYCSRAALRSMPAGGRIINMSSLAAKTGGGNGAVTYATSKAAMDGFTRGLAKEVAPRGILVNSIAPGFIGGTPFHATFTPPDAQQRTIESLPVKRGGTVEDVAGAVVFLASEASSFCTGIVLDVDGGAY